MDDQHTLVLLSSLSLFHSQVENMLFKETYILYKSSYYKKKTKYRMSKKSCFIKFSIYINGKDQVFLDMKY